MTGLGEASPGIRALAAGLLAAAALLGARSLSVMWREAERARVRAGSATRVPADAGDPELRRVAARRAEAAGDAAAAVQHLAALVRLRPLDAEARLRLGSALATRGEPAAASAQIAAATTIARNDPALWVHAAHARLALFRAGGDLGELQRALRLFRDALRRDAALVAAIQDALGEDLGTPANLAQVLPDEPSAWRAAGAHFARQRRWEAAQAAYGRAGTLGDEPAVQALARAQAAARAGDAAAAMDACDVAVAAARPAERTAVVPAAAALLRSLPTASHAAALARCVAWAARYPDTPAVAVALARWQADRGEAATALATLGALPADVRRQPEVLAALGHVSARAGQADAAEGYYRQALDLEPFRPERWLALIGVLEARGRIQDALALADRARGRHPNHAALTAARQRLLARSIRPGG